MKINNLEEVRYTHTHARIHNMYFHFNVCMLFFVCAHSLPISSVLRSFLLLYDYRCCLFSFWTLFHWFHSSIDPFIHSFSQSFIHSCVWLVGRTFIHSCCVCYDYCSCQYTKSTLYFALALTYDVHCSNNNSTGSTILNIVVLTWPVHLQCTLLYTHTQLKRWTEHTNVLRSRFKMKRRKNHIHISQLMNACVNRSSLSFTHLIHSFIHSILRVCVRVRVFRYFPSTFLFFFYLSTIFTFFFLLSIEHAYDSCPLYLFWSL